MRSQVNLPLFEQMPWDGFDLTPLERAIASLIYEAKDRLTIAQLEERLNWKVVQPPDDREIKRTIRSLRCLGLAILSSKRPPYGYWWCQSADEMREFVDRFKAQPMDELYTLSRMVKANFPHLAGQLSLDFAELGR